jgi:hypothetical protein
VRAPRLDVDGRAVERGLHDGLLEAVERDWSKVRPDRRRVIVASA